MTVQLNPVASIRALTASERIKVGLLSTWFFLTIMTLWLLKPIRTASLLSHLGAEELPYLRFGSVLAVGVVVFGYSRIVNHFSRLQVVLGATGAFASLLVAIWIAMQLGGDTLGHERWFVWAVFIMVDIYATVMVAMFWTYTNDVVSRLEADKLYGPIGLGGILGGIAGGLAVDHFVTTVGPVHMLLACVGTLLLGAAFAWWTEASLRPAPRAMIRAQGPGLIDTFEGAREVLRSSYLLKIVGIVVAYEFAAALTDYVINVVFERSFTTESELAQMYGRLGWIVSGTALLCQLLVVPILLPLKRTALLVPPVAMAAATLSLAIMPAVALAVALAASDRGLNYSLQQVTKETLYVPLSDRDRYKAKAFIDMFVDRAAKALSSMALLLVILFSGVSIRASLFLAFASLLVWARIASSLGHNYARMASDSAPEAVGTVGGEVAAAERQEEAAPALSSSADPA